MVSVIRDDCRCFIPTITGRRNFAKAKNSTLPIVIRILYGLMGVLESIPLVGIIISLIQVIIVKIYEFLIFISLECRLLRKRLKNPSLESRIEFPKKFTLDLTLFNKDYSSGRVPSYILRDLRLAIVNEYSSLPWPKDIKEVLILGKHGHGLGDAFYINKIERFFSKRISNFKTKFLSSFLGGGEFRKKEYLSPRIEVLKEDSIDPSSSPDIIVFFLLQSDNRKPRFLNKEMKGKPCVSFYETSHFVKEFDYPLGSSDQLETLIRDYSKLHSFLFSRDVMDDAVCLGLTRAGIFIDLERAGIPLSGNSHCLSFLLEIKDKVLKRTLFREIKKSREENISLNYGYSHYCSSKLNFLDCVALHEKEKDVCVVLTESQNFLDSGKSNKEFFLSKIIEKRELLRDQGFSHYYVKSPSGETLFSSIEEHSKGRSFTVILTSGLAHEDILNLQLASERLLCTGDMSFTESVEARCKMLCYETIHSLATLKKTFSMEVQNVASGISLGLSDFMGIFSSKDGDQLFTEEELEKVKEILRKGSFSQDTVNFCKLVKGKYSFEPVLEGLIKRKLWLERLPELCEVEARVLGERWKKAITSKFKRFLSRRGNVGIPDEEGEVVEVDVSSLKESLLSFIEAHK